MSSLTIEEVCGAKEIVPGREYWIRPWVHLVLVEHEGEKSVGCSNCISWRQETAEGAWTSSCLVNNDTRFKACLQRSSYYWKIKLVSEPLVVACLPPVQPSLF